LGGAIHELPLPVEPESPKPLLDRHVTFCSKYYTICG
jgi:hypothetical protein